MVEWMSGYPAKTTALLTKMNLLREDKADVVAGRSQSGVQTRRNCHLDHWTPARSSLARFPDPLAKVSGSGNLARLSSSSPSLIKTKVKVLKMVDLGNRRTQEKQTLRTSPPPWRLCKLVQASRCSRSSNVLWLDGGALPELRNNISTFFWTPHPL